jgi:hypothetical protein
MNVFEELVEELKDENLLEQNIVFPAPPVSNSKSAAGNAADMGLAAGDVENSAALGRLSDESQVPPEEMPELRDEAEYFRKRATDQVAGLKMVEHVMTGIEREYMKIVPAAFDDLKVKTALHTYLKVTAQPDATEQLEAEGLLIYETESWSKALSERDENISVANIRRFCENSRPVLSSQALLALARFYRVSPGSTAVRAKFDFVMTRLFSRDAGDDKRRLLFNKLEMIEHIRGLYENWADLTPFDQRVVDPSVAETLVLFRQAIEEAEIADSFDELISSDFFNRTRAIKESAADLLFVPEVTAAAIECNVRIGNRFVDLLKAEKANFSVEALEEKYGYSYDSAISGAASKTLLLADLIKVGPEEVAEARVSEVVQKAERSPLPVMAESKKKPVFEERGSGGFAVNKWLLAFTIIALAASLGIYYWSENSDSQKLAPLMAAQVSLEGSGLGEYLKTAKSSSETMYAVVQPNWETLSEQQKKDVLQKSQVFATSKGLRRVNLLNDKGRTVGYASKDRAEILKQ